MLNFHQLRAFYYVAENLHLGRAAEKLCVSQPAVTMQIKLFEEFCKLKLFKRRKQRLFLTQEGKTLYEYARRIFEYEKEIENVIGELRVLKRGCLNLGTTKTHARYLMNVLMTSFHEAYPQIKVSLMEGSSLEMMHRLLDFKIEVAIIGKVEENPEIQFIPFHHEPVLLIVSPDHPFTQKKTISFRELAKVPIIMRETGSETRRLVDALFSQNNSLPNVLLETSNVELIKQQVQRGEGVSFVTSVAVAQELSDRKLATVSIEEHQILLPTYIAYPKDQHLSPPARAFLEILKKLAPNDTDFCTVEAINASQQ